MAQQDQNNNEFLSQEELDALLKGLQEEQEDTEEKTEEKGNSTIELTSEEFDAIGEVTNVAMGAAATALSTMLGKKINISTPTVLTTSSQTLKENYSGKMVCTKVEYTEGIKGISLLLMEPVAAGIIADLMMGGPGKSDGQLDEITLSAVGESMNQMMGAAATTLSDFFSMKINIAPPEAKLVDFDDPNFGLPAILKESAESMVVVKFNMKIEDLISTEVLQIFDKELTRQLIRMFFEKTLGISQEVEEKVQQKKQTTEVSVPKPEKPKQKVKAQPVELPEFEEEPVEVEEKVVPSDRLSILYDIPLEISVELGRTKLTLKQVLELDKGSLIELDKLTGEYADILVNGKIIARGEVVVIGENFGVRITEIVSPRERLYSLK